MPETVRPSGGRSVMELSEAKRLGLLWYFTGKPCPRGHISKRSVSNRDCRSCDVERRAARRATNPTPFRKKDRAQYHKDVEASRAALRAGRKKHVEKRREYDRQRYHTDPARKDWQKKQATGWGQSNKGKRAATVAARRAAQARATPPWLTREHKAQIRAFYLEAARRPGEWHVDHIYPIKGKTSCGLHVPWNLQIITGDENRKKGNRIDGAE